MVSVTLKISEEFSAKINELSWINWSELAREETLKKVQLTKKIERFKKILLKSKLTLDDADKLSEKMKKSMHKSLVDEGLI